MINTAYAMRIAVSFPETVTETADFGVSMSSFIHRFWGYFSP